MTLAENLHRLRDRLDRAQAEAGRQVTLIAVSKRQPDQLVTEAYELGVRDFGENTVQELVRRREQLPEARWHLIGHLQTNKAKQAVQADLIHTIDSVRVAAAIVKHIDPSAPRSVLVQVNVSGEASKSGCQPDEVRPLLDSLFAMPELRVSGLMCVPAPDDAGGGFARLRALRDELERSLSRPLPELSMGMSSDFEEAIRAGSTMVRVGTVLFGPRPAARPDPPVAT